MTWPKAGGVGVGVGLGATTTTAAAFIGPVMTLLGGSLQTSADTLNAEACGGGREAAEGAPTDAGLGARFERDEAESLGLSIVSIPNLVRYGLI